MLKKLKREKKIVILSLITLCLLLSLLGYGTDRYKQWNVVTYIQNYSTFTALEDAKNEDLFPFMSQDLTSVRKIVFNRVPKCASTLSRILFKHLSEKKNFEFIFVISDEKKNFNLTSQRRVISMTKDVKIPWMYVQHFYLFDFTEHGQEMPMHINIVRDPLERLISSYYFNRYNLHIPMSQKDFNMTFEECVRGRHHECTGRGHISQVLPYFCGSLANCTRPSDWTLARAKQNVMKYYSVVGYMEELAKFYFVLETAMPQFFGGLQDVYRDKGSAYLTKHSTKNIVGTTELSDASKEYLYKLLAKDYDFYYFIKQRFHLTYTHYYMKAHSIYQDGSTIT